MNNLKNFYCRLRHHYIWDKEDSQTYTGGVTLCLKCGRVLTDGNLSVLADDIKEDINEAKFMLDDLLSKPASYDPYDDAKYENLLCRRLHRAERVQEILIKSKETIKSCP